MSSTVFTNNAIYTIASEDPFSSPIKVKSVNIDEEPRTPTNQGIEIPEHIEYAPRKTRSTRRTIDFSD